jgi:hypothetical protein
MFEVLIGLACALIGGFVMAWRLREPGESVLSAMMRAVRPQSGPRPTTPKSGPRPTTPK